MIMIPPRVCWAPRVTRDPQGREDLREPGAMSGLPDLKVSLVPRENLVGTDWPAYRDLQAQLLPCLSSPSLPSSPT